MAKLDQHVITWQTPADPWDASLPTALADAFPDPCKPTYSQEPVLSLSQH